MSDVKGLKSLLEEKGPTLISLEDFKDGGSWDIGNLEKVFNVERHALEANEI